MIHCTMAWIMYIVILCIENEYLLNYQPNDHRRDSFITMTRSGLKSKPLLGRRPQILITV